jgi:hypothetical protein
MLAAAITVTMLMMMIIVITEFIIHFGKPVSVRISQTFLPVNISPIADVTARRQ